MSLEEDAMNLLACIAEVYPLDSISEELIQATKNAFMRMHIYKNKTRAKRIPDSFLKAVFIFMARFILHNGSDALIGLCDQIQEGIILNFFEKEGHCIGRFSKNDYYRRHVIAAFTTFITQVDALKGTPAMVAIVQGLIENICPTGKFDQGLKNLVDDGLPAEFQEESINFERTAFQPLQSVENFKPDSLPKIENYTLHVLQCIEEVVKHESPGFISQVGEKLTKDTQNYFGQLLQEYNINLG